MQSELYTRPVKATPMGSLQCFNGILQGCMNLLFSLYTIAPSHKASVRPILGKFFMPSQGNGYDFLLPPPASQAVRLEQLPTD